MTTNSNSISNEEVDSQAEKLAEEIEKANQEMEAYNSQFKEKMESIEEKTAELSEKSDKAFSEMDQIEKETEDEIDGLILEQAEVLANESNEVDSDVDEDSIDETESLDSKEL